MKEDGKAELEQGSEQPAKKQIRLKPFSFVMLLISVVLVTAGITFIVLMAGDDKVVDVGSPIQKVDRKEFEKLYNAYDEMKKSYYETIDETAVINGAINGMIEALGDPYSDYLNEDEARQLNESISSSFEGIGAEIQESDGYIAIVSPIKNSPAERAGLLPHDKIIAVDGKSIQGLSSSEAVLLIRGEKGTTVVLSIMRGEAVDPVDIKITRDVIPLETVYSEMLGDNIAHIRITSFSTGTYDELLLALDDMEAQGMKGMIVDVRQNPGGRLDIAMEISDLFVESGKNLFQYEEKSGKPDIYPAKGGRKVTVPVTLVMDEGSASASEILAAALKESADIPLIGVNTFGKGTVQTPKDLPDGSNLKITTAKWLTPNGNWIHKVGIKPDFEVPYPPYAMLPYLDPTAEMKDGMQSTIIKSAEEMLEAIGYKPGEIDGLFDEDTVVAVKNLQDDLSLETTGILSGDTTFGLMEKLREKIQKDDPQLLKAKDVLREKIGK
ncbi:S41 family peptidase [Sporosarcina sp. G11-34]|uniref:lmo1851 family serine protease n=1 Tax=Sporosarcina sp. G11-34 TaxID=2849605 RepID=UPI0022A9302F|nr:S41 family peptidase [Sporosarcina sp. G11-34]MCZ2258248.1 S41 family peptidase [Sporosarcina sp. G11-34]